MRVTIPYSSGTLFGLTRVSESSVQLLCHNPLLIGDPIRTKALGTSRGPKASHNPLLIGDPIRTTCPAVSRIRGVGSQSPTHRGPYSDLDKLVWGVIGLSHNPLLIGDPIRTITTTSSPSKVRYVTIPYSSGTLFGPKEANIDNSTLVRHNPLLIGDPIRTAISKRPMCQYE